MCMYSMCITTCYGTLTLVQYPQRRIEGSVSLIEEDDLVVTDYKLDIVRSTEGIMDGGLDTMHSYILSFPTLFFSLLPYPLAIIIVDSFLGMMSSMVSSREGYWSTILFFIPRIIEVFT